VSNESLWIHTFLSWTVTYKYRQLTAIKKSIVLLYIAIWRLSHGNKFMAYLNSRIGVYVTYSE